MLDKPARILIIDDDATGRLLCQETLEPHGYVVEAAADGTAGLTAFQQDPPDLVFLDLQMPGVTGFEVCRQMRATPVGAHVPIIVLTGSEDEVAMHRAYNAGATDFILKPVRPRQLVERVRFSLKSKRTSDRLRWHEQQLRIAQRLARVGLWEFDANGTTRTWSPQTSAVLGQPAEYLPKTVTGYLQIVHPADFEAVRTALESAFSEQRLDSLEYRVRTPAGKVRIVRQEGIIDVVNGQLSLLGIVQDITHRRAAERRAHDLTFNDSLTGLLNRDGLLRELESRLEDCRHDNTELAVMTVDLAGFSRVNNSLGRSAGDTVLRTIAARLQSQLCEASAAEGLLGCGLARKNGDEFAMLLLGTVDKKRAQLLTRRLRDSICEGITASGETVVVPPRFGLATFPHDGGDGAKLLAHAELALQGAKQTNDGQVCFYSSMLDDQAKERMRMESGLRAALEGDGLFLVYQPKVVAGTGEPVSAEALIRWRHPDLGELPPSRFIPVAESSGLICALGRWVLSETCRQIRAWQDGGVGNVQVAVNVSVAQLLEPRLPSYIQALLAKYGLQPESLGIEITETMLMDDFASVVEALTTLKQMGIRIAIDDFGTGYSSLSYLTRLPVDALKIDRAFVQGAVAGDSGAAVVKTVIALARSMGLATVAEGVETDVQRAIMVEQGCDEIQGFFFSKPLLPEDFAHWWQGNERRNVSAVTTLSA